MTDPVCDPAIMHYFKTPLYDGEKCQCQQTIYNASIAYHHKPDDDDYKPFNHSMDLITSPWAPLMQSVMLGSNGFGGGSSGGAGASGDW